MSAEEFRLLTIAKTEHEATSQHNVIYKALTHARMEAAGLVDKAPSAHGGPVPADGGAPDTPRPKVGVTQAALDSFDRSEEHTSELQSLMRISYAVFCLKKKNR